MSKALSLFVLIFALALSSAFAQQPVSQGGQSPPAGGVPRDTSVPGPQVVKPGAQSTPHDDGVEVVNDAASNGTATVKTSSSDADAVTTVTTRTGFVGTVKGLDGNDVVELGSSNKATVSGEGGKVSIGGGSTVKVENTSPAGGPNIEVSLPSGTTASVGPGSTVTFNT